MWIIQGTVLRPLTHADYNQTILQRCKQELVGKP